MNYLIVSTVCIISLAIGTFALLENEIFSNSRKKKFIILALIIIFEVAIDTIAFEIDGRLKDQTAIYKALKTLEFIISPTIPAIFANIISSSNFWKKIRIAYIIIMCINLIVQLINMFFQFLFFIDENGYYVRTEISLIYIAILGICFILLLICANHTYIQKTSKVNITLHTLILLILLGVIIRGIKSEANSDWLCITISYYIFIIYYSNNYFKLDPLTKLLNRGAFETMFARINYSTAIIIIDVNDFKTINDTYGHQNGDIALSKIAETVGNIYAKYGYCYRIGGDEFCVILKKHALDKLLNLTRAENYFAAIKNLNYMLDIKLKRISKKCEMLSNGVSQGFEIYDVNGNSTLEDTFRVADEKMYSNKKKS